MSGVAASTERKVLFCLSLPWLCPLDGLYPSRALQRHLVDGVSLFIISTRGLLFLLLRLLTHSQSLVLVLCPTSSSRPSQESSPRNYSLFSVLLFYLVFRIRPPKHPSVASGSSWRIHHFDDLGPFFHFPNPRQNPGPCARDHFDDRDSAPACSCILYLRASLQPL